MGLLRRSGLENDDTGAGFSLDLDEKACPVCLRELKPWQTRCPDDGTAAVRKTDIGGRDDVTPRPGLLDDLDEIERRDGGGPA